MDFKGGPRPSPTVPSTTGSPPEQGVAKSEAELAAILRVAGLDDPARMAKAMLSGLRDGKLDLRGKVAGDALLAMPKKAWQALERSGAIAELCLPALTHADHHAELCRRLAGLSGLKRLSIELAQAGRHADLSGLPASVRSIELDVPRRDVEITVVARPDTQLHATARDHAVLAPVNVAYAGKQAGQPRRLQGLAFVRTPVALDGKSKPRDDKEEVQMRRGVAGTQNNARTSFKGTTAQLARLPRPEIVCRHLATQWVIDRLAARTGESKSRRSPDFYGLFDDKHVIAARASPELQQLFSTLLKQAIASPRCSFGEFGAKVADLMRDMNAGDTREYLLMTADHAMALELRRKQHPDGRYVEEVRLFDPNWTATDVCVQAPTLGALRGRPIGTWLDVAGMPARSDSYASAGDRLTFVLVDASSLESARSSLGKPLPSMFRNGEADLAERMSEAMQAGDIDGLRKAVHAVTESVHRDRVLPILLALDGEGTPAVVRAIRKGHENQVLAYVQVMLEAPRLSAQVRREVVTGTWRDSANEVATAWDYRSALDHPRMALGWWRIVMNSSLDVPAIGDLLRSRKPTALHFELYVHEISAPGPDTLKLQRQLLCELVLAIARTERFTRQQVIALTWPGSNTSVEALERRGKDPRHILGSQAEVVRALKKCGRPPEDIAWLIRHMAPDWTEPTAKGDAKS